MGKLLTVIVPSYNMERYLPKCLGSLIVADSALLERLDGATIGRGIPFHFVREWRKDYSRNTWRW